MASSCAVVKHPCKPPLVAYHAAIGVLALFCIGRPTGVQAECNEEMLAKFPSGWPKTLDVGIYWFGPNDETERATGSQSTYYDPSKKTVILIDGWDGWATDKVITCHRLTSFSQLTAHGAPNTSIVKPWIERGWNFGIFYWDQFADTTCTTWAETKIWQGKEDPRMTWKSYDVKTQKEERITYDGPDHSVGQLCARSLREAMPTLTSETVRLAGFSMGAQVASSCAQNLHEDTPNHPARPRRLTLIDPFFQSLAKGVHLVCYGSGIDFTRTLRLTVHAVQSLWKRGVAMELYKGSSMTEHVWWGFNPGLEMETLGTTVYWDPTYCGYGLTSLACRHRACVALYFLRVDDGRSKIEGHASTVGNCTVPGPACTDNEIMQLLKRENKAVTKGKRHIWTQWHGMVTTEMHDDVFRYVESNVPTNVKLPLVPEVIVKLPLEPRWMARQSMGSVEAQSPAARQASTLHGHARGVMIAAVVFACVCCVLSGIGCLMMLQRKKSAVRSRACCAKDDSRDLVHSNMEFTVDSDEELVPDISGFDYCVGWRDDEELVSVLSVDCSDPAYR